MDMNLLEAATRYRWRQWLADNHRDVPEIWLVFWKRHTGRPTLDYGASVEESLCFGWVDSLVKRIDDDRYARKFTPRRRDSVWSALNRERAERMIREGRMTESGLDLVKKAGASGAWEAAVRKPEIETVEMPVELGAGLEASSSAKLFFEALAPSKQRMYRLWVGSAKRAETRKRRAGEAIQKLARGEELGLK